MEKYESSGVWASASRRRGMYVVCALMIAAGAHPSAAAAQVDRIAQARQLFVEGVAAAEAQDWARAEDIFRRARSLHASPALTLNHATALSHLGRLREASELLRRLNSDAAVPRAVRDESIALLATFEPRIGRLTVVVRGASDTTIALDGVEVPRTDIGVPFPIDPGTHAITSSRGGVEVARAEAVVGDGQLLEVVLVVPDAVVVEAEPELAPPEPLFPVAALEITPTDTSVPPENLAENGWLWLGVGLGVAVIAAVAIPVGVVLGQPAEAPPPVCGNVGCWTFGP